MTRVPLPALFTYSHIRRPISFRHFLLLLYVPIGLSLVVLRLVLLVPYVIFFFVAPSFFFPSWLLRMLALPFGIIVRARGVDQYRADIRQHPVLIVSSNHVTPVDVFPFLAVNPVYVLLDFGFYRNILSTFGKVVGAIPLDKTSNEAERKANVRAMLEQQLPSLRRPVLFFPEGWDCNAKVGIMRFNKFLFSLGHAVTPVAMRAHVPFLPLEPSILGTTLLVEVIWLLFYPCIVYDLLFMAAEVCSPRETEAQFARRIQCQTAAALGVEATEYSNKDALALRLEILHRPELRSQLIADPYEGVDVSGLEQTPKRGFTREPPLSLST